MRIITGLDRLLSGPPQRAKAKGRIGYLSHAASVDKNLDHGILGLKKVFGKRLVKILGPQHGFVTDVQDNMVESRTFNHPFFDLPVYSLYGETRAPTQKMLEGLDTLIIDLQDVGCRIYTYFSTLGLTMKECAKANVRVVVLDRPNPIGCTHIEGNILDPAFSSFVGLYPIPVRHGLTIGEMANLINTHFHEEKCILEVIPMKGYKRSMFFEDTGLPWVLPSPNLATVDAAFTFVGTVLFEGTNISEGRGTARALEIVGSPKLKAWSLAPKLEKIFLKEKLSGFKLRPLSFLPTFQKWANTPCEGFQIHVTNRKTFRPWRVGQILLREFRRELGADFEWKKPPYEYEFEKMPIDLINGTDHLRRWVEDEGPMVLLEKEEAQGMKNYLNQRKEILLYS
jgi:uncharacterized protein YbbC (DUF1343 family)